MADRDDALVAELRDLAGWLDVSEPDPGRYTAAVTARLRDAGRPVRYPRPARWRRWVAAACAAAVGTVIAVVPPARAAVVDAVGGLLRFAGIEIRDEPGPAPGTLPATPSPLPSVRSAALDDARRLAKFPVRAPAALGVPEGVEVADPGPDGAPRVVSLAYRGGTVRLDQFDGELEPVFAKSAPNAQFVDVNADFAIWLPGPHALVYIDRAGQRQVAGARLAAPTLIWTDRGVTYRLEGLPLAEAVTAAESLV